jgi:threonyl-tRNA synthetase
MEDKVQFCVKPMNCPGGILIYNQGIKSYKDLPIRMAEFGKVNRFEPSGSLNGFLRVREFTQDDAHIFCTLSQTEKEISNAITTFMEVYHTFGFKGDDIVIGLSTRPEKRIGSEEVWDKSEKFLMQTLDKLKIKYKIQIGEGAFYGPKLEFGFKDALNRSWQIGTIQLDMNLPSRFQMSYIGDDGQKHEPVMLHLALFGSIERFLGMYIEHTEGKFPL